MTNPPVSQTEPTVSGDPLERFEPPGGILVWIIVFVEIVTFGAGLIVFLVQGNEHSEVFLQGRKLLNQPVAFANTLILLVGGWCMASGIAALRLGHRVSSSRWIAASVVMGVAFLVLKGVEYSEKIEHGIGLGHDTFFTLYYLLTGFHFLHVFVAVILLAVMWSGVRAGKYDGANHGDVESSAIFWHMCDLIWLLLYPIVYLVP